MSQTYNHIAAAPSGMGLTNPSCTSSAYDWLEKSKPIQRGRVKYMKLFRSDFGRREKKKKKTT